MFCGPRRPTPYSETRPPNLTWMWDAPAVAMHIDTHEDRRAEVPARSDPGGRRGATGQWIGTASRTNRVSCSASCRCRYPSLSTSICEEPTGDGKTLSTGTRSGASCSISCAVISLERCRRGLLLERNRGDLLQLCLESRELRALEDRAADQSSCQRIDRLTPDANLEVKVRTSRKA